MEKQINHYKMMTIIWHIAQIFFGLAFWIQLIIMIINNMNVFRLEAKSFVLSLIFGVIGLYIVINFNASSKYATPIAISALIFLALSVVYFGIYFIKTSIHIPRMALLPSIIAILLYTLSKELRISCKTSLKELENQNNVEG